MSRGPGDVCNNCNGARITEYESFGFVAYRCPRCGMDFGGHKIKKEKENGVIDKDDTESGGAQAAKGKGSGNSKKNR